MRVIVAGGSGFVGRHVVATLMSRGHGVLVLARGTRVLRGVETLACDVTEPLPLERLRGFDAIVNLAGIKREGGRQTFEAVHVDATKRLLEAARSLGIPRFVHVSVVCSRPDPDSAYHDTKWRAEQLVRSSKLGATVLKPGVIYGPGDDMTSHLIKMIRFAPFFPVVGRGDSILQPVDARDVADAVAAALERDESIGRSYDVVGPNPMPLRQVVKTVAAGLGLSILTIPTPIPVQRVAVFLMNALTATPLSTPAQLRMLIDGLGGDPEPARRELGVDPRPFTADAVRGYETTIPALFGWSIRLVDRGTQSAWLRGRAAAFPRAVGLAALAVLLLPVLSWLGNVWLRMATGAAILIPMALIGVDVGWRELFVPTARRVMTGALGALVLYAVSAFALRALRAIPGVAAQIASLYTWKAAVDHRLMIPLLVFIVLGEEIVWRNAVTLPLAARLGPWKGVLAANLGFAAAHVSLGVPVLPVAALGAGTFWSALVVKTRSAVPSLVCHLLWDLAMLVWLPQVAQ